MHLAGFIMTIYHDAWSPEHQTKCLREHMLGTVVWTHRAEQLAI